MSVSEIQNSVAELSERERGSLAVWLLDSLPPHDAADASNEGTEEAARRRDELNSGKTQAVAAGEFWESIKRERSAWK